MQQVEIHVVYAQVLEGRVYALRGRLIAVVLQPELAGDEQLVARDVRLVEVRGGGVYVPVPGLYRVERGVVGLLAGGDGEHAKAHHRDAVAVIESNSLHVCLSFFAGSMSALWAFPPVFSSVFYSAGVKKYNAAC